MQRRSPPNAAGLLFPLVTGALALACGAPSPAPPSTSPDFTGHYFHDLHLAVTYDNKYNCVAPDAVQATWNLASELDVKDIAATGWIAVTGVPGAQGKPVAFTSGNESLAGIVEKGAITFDPLGLSSNQGKLDIAELSLKPVENGHIEGTARGTYTLTDGGDYECPMSFTAQITGEPDKTAPGAKLQAPDPAVHLPFDTIGIPLTEPASTATPTLEVRAGGTVVPSKLVQQKDKRPGFFRGFTVAPETAWPEGASLTLSLGGIEDAAGNAQNIELGPFTIVKAVDAGDDLGFESGLDHWVCDPPWDPDPKVTSLVDTWSVYTATDGNGQSFDVTPHEGSSLVAIQSGRLAGRLVPPAGKTRLHLWAAFADSFIGKDPGLSIELIKDGARIAFADGTALPPVADPLAGWTGWGEVVLDLPAEASSGFWLVVRLTSNASPIHMPVALLDGLFFD